MPLTVLYPRYWVQSAGVSKQYNLSKMQKNFYLGKLRYCIQCSVSHQEYLLQYSRVLTAVFTSTYCSINKYQMQYQYYIHQFTTTIKAPSWAFPLSLQPAFPQPGLPRPPPDPAAGHARRRPAADRALRQTSASLNRGSNSITITDINCSIYTVSNIVHFMNLPNVCITKQRQQ